MKKKNIISILNKQIIGSERDNIKITTVGTYVKKDKKGYIIYEDCKDGSSANKVRVSIIKIESPNRVIVNKIGKYRSQLVLEKGKRHYCQYATEYGIITVGIYTEYIECNLGKSTAEMRIKYFMDINADVTLINEVYIDVKENVKNVKYINNAN